MSKKITLPTFSQNKDNGKKTESKGNTIFHITEKYLNENYNFRYNTISKTIELKPIDRSSPWDTFNENSIYIELQKEGIRCSTNNLISIVKSDFTQHYDPLENYFSELKKWNKHEGSYISKISEFIKTKNPKAFSYSLKKWLVRCVKCALIPAYFNKQAFVLVHHQQDSGKSTFCRWLCPPQLSEYIAEDISSDKDSRIMLTKNFLINLDELSSLHKKEINSLKAMFSKDKINARLPYDRKNSILNRTCSFMGSTNLSEFLTDETGSVRWLCFEILKINWDYKKEININDVWREAYTLHLEGFECQLSKEDIIENEERNLSYQLRSVEFETIQKYFEIPKNKNAGSFYTATDVVQLINTHTSLNVNRTMVGRAINSLKYPKIRRGQIHGYSMIFNAPIYN